MKTFQGTAANPLVEGKLNNERKRTATKLPKFVEKTGKDMCFRSQSHFKFMVHIIDAQRPPVATKSSVISCIPREIYTQWSAFALLLKGNKSLFERTNPSLKLWVENN